MFKIRAIILLGSVFAGCVYASPNSHYTLLELLGSSKTSFSVCNKIDNLSQDKCNNAGNDLGIYSSPITSGNGLEYFYSIYWSNTADAPKFDISCDGVTVNPQAGGAYFIGNGKYLGYAYKYNPENNLISCQPIVN